MRGPIGPVAQRRGAWDFRRRRTSWGASASQTPCLLSARQRAPWASCRSLKGASRRDPQVELMAPEGTRQSLIFEAIPLGMARKSCRGRAKKARGRQRRRPRQAAGAAGGAGAPPEGEETYTFPRVAALPRRAFAVAFQADSQAEKNEIFFCVLADTHSTTKTQHVH